MITGLFSYLIFAAVTLSWVPPDKNTDGTALTDLAGYKLYQAQVSGGPYSLLVDINDPATTSYVFDPPPGDYWFVATAYNVAGVESAYSGEAMKTVLEVITPDPPANLVVTGNLVAYGIQQTADVLRVFPVGSLPEGTPCDPNTSVNGMYLVPRNSVTYVGSLRPATIFAQCAGSGN